MGDAMKLTTRQLLCGENLVGTLRVMCENVKNRIWIAVPFVGAWQGVEKILGRNWLENPNIDVRLLTDIKNQNYIDRETTRIFQKIGQIKSLKGLHAKIYILDNKAIITSANLSETAFARRYEVGVLKNDIVQLQGLFDEWWQKGKNVDSNWLPQKKKGIAEDEDSGAGLSVLWKMPKVVRLSRLAKRYTQDLIYYRHFTKLYLQSTTKRVFPPRKLPLFQEVDSFFNFLFHEHPKRPSYKYRNRKYRKITDSKRQNQVSRHVKSFKQWVSVEDESYRVKRIKLVQEYLRPEAIKNLSLKKVEEILGCLHCMNSVPLNKAIFTNPRNNSLKKIRKNWTKLLHDSSLPVENRIDDCNRNLMNFGLSAIRELLSCYYPEEYPVMNNNSNSGMRLFGYDVK